MKHSKLIKRFLSALVLGPSFLYALYLGGYVFLGVIALCFVICAVEWISLGRKTENPYLMSFIGFIYLLSAFLNFAFLRSSASEWLGLEWYYAILPLLLCVWASDIGGYTTGKLFGEVRPFPRISPNKTWAGFYGAILTPGILLGLCASFVYAFTADFTLALIPVALGVGILLGVLGQIGDLLISAIKRMAEVKDTGSIIPGHGGLMDRIDSLLLATLFFPSILLSVMWMIKP